MGMLTEFLWSMMVFLLAVRIMGTVLKLLTNKMRIQDNKIEAKPVEKASEEKEEKVLEIEMVQDMICGAHVPKHKAYQVARDNVTHYFCSWECRQKFILSVRDESE